MNQIAWLRERWSAVSRREQTLVLGALILVLGALLWWLAVAPALATLREAPDQQRLLDAQLQQMRRLQAQAKALQAQPRPGAEEVRRLLQASLTPLGNTAQLAFMGERVTLTLKGAGADALAQWLAQVRQNARVLPSEARLVRSATGGWDGSLTLILKTP